jgi:hypothetical protein
VRVGTAHSPFGATWGRNLSLHSRLVKLEAVDTGGAPTYAELRAACQLLDRHFMAIKGVKVFDFEPDPAEVKLMQDAEADGRIAAAREIVRRQALAHGREDPYPTNAETIEKRRKAVLANLEAAFGDK